MKFINALNALWTGFITAITGLITGIISALNLLGTAWVAIVVVCIGMYFALQANKAGLPSDIASGVIGAGIGLLTGQTMANRAGAHTTSTVETVIPPVPVPADPTQVPKQGD